MHQVLSKAGCTLMSLIKPKSTSTVEVDHLDSSIRAKLQKLSGQNIDLDAEYKPQCSHTPVNSIMQNKVEVEAAVEMTFQNQGGGSDQ